MMLRWNDSRRIGGRSTLSTAVIGSLLATLVLAAPAFAEAPAVPHWRLESLSAPTNLPLHGEGVVIVSAANLGDAPFNGEADPITITDTLPTGLEVIAAPGGPGGGSPGSIGEHRPRPQPEPTCSVASVSSVECRYAGTLLSYEQLEFEIKVRVNVPAASRLPNDVTVSGGGASSSTLSTPLDVNGEPTAFGVERYELTPENDEFEPDLQAGSHPFQLTTTLDLNEGFESQLLGHGGVGGGPVEVATAPALAQNLSFNLPPGLVGDANVKEGNPVGQCSDVEFGALERGSINGCPGDSAVGVVAATVLEPVGLTYETVVVPVFNLTPALGEPARFGFNVHNIPVVLDTAVRTGEGYGVTVSVHNTSEAFQLLRSRVTFWGVPGDRRHDEARGWECLGAGTFAFGNPHFGELGCHPSDPADPQSFLTLPTSCGSLKSTVEGNAWNGSTLVGPSGEDATPGESPVNLTGCEGLPFAPTTTVKPDKQSASTPSGLGVEINLPQEGTLSAEGLAEADLKETTVELPEGMQAAAGAANGLQTCSAGQFGLASGLPESSQLENEHLTDALPSPECPDASKIGTVEINTPLLPNAVTGAVYLAQQNTNPFASPLVLYLIAEDPVSKVLVKLAGEVKLDQSTGRLTSTFKNTPPLPFEHLKLHLFDTERATQSTPPLCGPYTTDVSMTPWSGGPLAKSSSTFDITQGANGPCENANPQSFSPTLQAGSTNTQAGALTPFTLNIAHPDADQPLQGLTMHLPPGLAALLASVTPCEEPQVANNQCGPQSLIGHSTTSAGLGESPYTLPGEVYLTGPYKGAPFGLSVVTPAVAGPFNLGEVTVRSTINVDPSTAAVTITSDPFPTILRGVPTQIKQLNVTIDRPGFQFNPTNCTPMAITATLNGSQGGSQAVSSPFTVANCASLPFKPKLTASAGAKASKAKGASLNVKIESAGLGQANLHKVDLTLPKALPSRLTTIQKACVDAVFNVNPAGCDEGSVIGVATVHTPVLKSPLSGPAYLVSHGNAAFPDVEFVLQGEGITLILDGKTDIKKGITYSRFETAPDAPFTTFETVLPTGPHSAFTANVPQKANYSLCGQNLAMPTEITAQDGAVIKQSTSVAVTGCAKAAKVKALTRAQKLKKALKACKKKKNKGKRGACEKQARKRFGAKKSKKRSTKT
jgi:hypothetical protein